MHQQHPNTSKNARAIADALSGRLGWWVVIAFTLGLFVLFYTLIAKTRMLDDSYWRWPWWTAIAFSLVLLLLSTLLVSKTKETGKKILGGYIQNGCLQALKAFSVFYVWTETIHLIFRDVVFRFLDAFLLFLALLAFVIVPVAKVRPRVVPFDWWVRFIAKSRKMEACQFPRRQERVADALVLAHLSDLHLTEDFTIEGGLQQQQVRERALAALTWALERSDFVVVTGDITDRGRYSEWRQFLGIMEELKVPLASNKLLLVPGNHDLSMTTETYAPQLAFEERAFAFVHQVLRNAPPEWMMVGIGGEYTSLRKYLDDRAWYFDLYQKQRPICPTGVKLVYPEGLGALAPGLEGTASRAGRWHGPLHCADFLNMAYPMVMHDDEKYLIIALNSSSFLAASLWDGAIGELTPGQHGRFVNLISKNSAKCIIVLVHHHIGFPPDKHEEFVKACGIGGHMQARALALLEARIVAYAISILPSSYLFNGHIHFPFTAQLGRGKVISGPSVTYNNGTSPQCCVYQIHPRDGIAILDEVSFGGLSGVSAVSETQSSKA
jgi:hypothetical protein